MEDPIVDYYPSYLDEDVEEEDTEENKSSSSSRLAEWIVNTGLSLGKKAVITGFVITSIPVILPPLAVVSALGVATSVPFGLVFASYACTDSLMSKLLLPQPHSPRVVDESPQGEEDAEFDSGKKKNGVADDNIGSARDVSKGRSDGGLKKKKKKKKTMERMGLSEKETKNDDLGEIIKNGGNNIFLEDEMWRDIDAIRVIVGMKNPRRALICEELKELYLFAGVEPPSMDFSDSGTKLSFLKSVIGLK